MKRFKFYPMIAAMISLLVFNACKEDPTLSVSQNSLSFTAEETSAKTVGVETNQDYWAASSSESWVTAQQNGNQLSVSVSKNESFQSDRNATITVSAGEAVPVTISVTQEKTTRYLSVGESTVSYAYDQTGDKAVPISTNDKNWKVSTTATWFTAKKLNESTLVVTVAKANSTITALSGVISVTGEDGGDGQSITVTQGAAPPSISISPSSLSFEYNASSSKSVTVTSNDANWTVKSNNTWITVSKSSASVSVSVSNNTSTSSRSGTVTFTAGSGSTAVTKELSVTQTGTPATNTLSVSPTSLSFTYNATSAQTVTVTTNASSWSYSTTSSWITCTKSGNTLSVKVSTNSSTSSRSGTITFTAGTATSVSVSVTQAGGSTTPTNTYSGRAMGETGNYFTWNGTFEEQTAYIKINSWPGSSYPMYLNKNSGLYLDNDYLYELTSSYFITFDAFELNSSGELVDWIEEYKINYNSTSRTLTFPPVSGSNYVFVFLTKWGYSGTTLTSLDFLSTLVLDVTLTLSSSISTYSASQTIGDTVYDFEKQPYSISKQRVKDCSLVLKNAKITDKALLQKLNNLKRAKMGK